MERIAMERIAMERIAMERIAMERIAMERIAMEIGAVTVRLRCLIGRACGTKETRNAMSEVCHSWLWEEFSACFSTLRLLASQHGRIHCVRLEG
jgi:hypothetical protein